MGYFATMMRQTGIHLGPTARRPLPMVQRLDREESRIAEVPAKPNDSIAAASAFRTRNAHEGGQETRFDSSSFRSLAREEQPSFRKPKQSAATGGAPGPILEYTVHTEAEITHVEIPRGNTSREQVADFPKAEAETSSIAALHTGESLPISRELKSPSMAEVLEWVAEPLRKLAQPSSPSPPIIPPQKRESIDVSHEGYNLEIGTIEIVVDAHPQPQATRSGTAAQSGQSQSRTSSQDRISRHYLRS
jgi:hypothetical protein